jgi:tRNA threonylcarbamoyladenosine biosynthesis protein TsaE
MISAGTILSREDCACFLFSMLYFIMILNMINVITQSLEETQVFAKSYFEALTPSTDSATVICLHGNLGAGKTALTQAFARELGIQEAITSPTFVIEKFYELDPAKNNLSFKRLVHIDAYRLTSGRELEVLNFEELVSNKNNLIVIEWPENVKEILPENHLKIFCEFVDETTRKFAVQ